MSHPACRATSRGTYHPLLGTNIEVRVVAVAGSDAMARAAAEAAERSAVAEMERLQDVFTVFDDDSELCRWRSGRLDAPSADLIVVLAAAQRWWDLSGGAFHPASAALRRRWRHAEAEGEPPRPAELAELARSLAALPYRVDGDAVVRVGDCSGVDLNAIAKGYIVDRGVAAASGRGGVVDVLVNAGGDLRHTGTEPVRVGVEDPDAVGGRPVAVLTLAEGALATSGSVHRGFRVAERWFGHVIDPRSGRPVENRPSTTVRAPDAMTADALATVAGVLEWDEASAIIAAEPDAAALAVLPGGRVVRAGQW